jgi:hypothetical protein
VGRGADLAADLAQMVVHCDGIADWHDTPRAGRRSGPISVRDYAAMGNFVGLLSQAANVIELEKTSDEVLWRSGAQATNRHQLLGSRRPSGIAFSCNKSISTSHTRGNDGHHRRSGRVPTDQHVRKRQASNDSEDLT